MTRFVPLALRDGTVMAIDAHAVTGIVEMPDGFSRVWTGEDSYEVPDSVTDLAALLSDPPRDRPRFVALDEHTSVNPARVAWVQATGEEMTNVWFSASVGEFGEDFVEIHRPAADVVAKLEGRAS